MMLSVSSCVLCILVSWMVVLIVLVVMFELLVGIRMC